MDSKPTVHQQVESILRDELRISVPSPDAELLESGLLDSLALVDLIASLERTFDITIDLLEVDFDDIGSIPSISRLVERLRTPGPPDGP